MRGRRATRSSRFFFDARTAITARFADGQGFRASDLETLGKMGRNPAPMTQGLPPAVLDLRAPLIGRDADLRRLDSSFERALGDGDARAITLVGPAGIGKTRLVNEYLKTRAPTEPA